MTTLEQLETRVRAIFEERARGDAFEAVVLRWLTAEPDLGLRSAWRWADWPERVRRGLAASDDGIDLVGEDRDGAPVAIQVKFRSDPDRPITREEAQKSLSFPGVFNRYLVISNAWSRTRSASRGLAEEGRLSWALREELERSEFDWLAALAGPVAPSARFTLRPHQKQAVADTVAALTEPGRAQVRMACGTGKTLAALWVAEGLGVERGLVLAPTLLLLKQLRAEWLREADEPFAALAVCSSDDVGEGGDAWELDPSDIPGEVTTDPARIAEFLRRAGRRVVFSTYQSSPRVAEAMADPSVPAFDLAVADEAHKVAGVARARDGRTSAQRTILDGTRIRATRRLFLTATPRVYGAGQRNRLEDDFGVEVASMDDVAAFGRVAHEFGFRSAVEAGILADYRLIVTVADDEAAARAISERELVDVDGRPVDADQVATAIAIRRAIAELSLRRVISFHSTVARARTFAGLVPDVLVDDDAPRARWISGAQPVHDRELVLSELREPIGAVVVSNARCLTEGIDVPALDAVAFADPRRSPVDLVQAIGRAMRLAPGKTTGWIIVPVHLGPDELDNPEAAVESSAFEPVLAVLRALRSHDPLLASDAARLRLSLGPRPSPGDLTGDRTGLPIDVVGPTGLSVERLLGAIRLRALEVSADPWSSGIAALRAFVAREGHARVPGEHLEGSLRLGLWVKTRRTERNTGRLNPERAAELGVLPGWTWDPNADDWALYMNLLRGFVVREGHARVPKDHREGSVRVGVWVNTRRQERNSGRLSADRVAELEALPGWTWYPWADDRKAAMAALRAYAAREGHARVPTGHVERGIRLGGWVIKQRMDHGAGRISAANASDLETVPGWTWDPIADDWAAAMAVLHAFATREGHARVPVGHVEDGVNLGNWVANQRSGRRSSRLSPDQIAELGAVRGWTWDPLADDWTTAMATLRRFVTREGHARVPVMHVEGSFKLGPWVAVRRRDHANGRLKPELVAALEGLPGWTWDPVADDLAAIMAALRAFVAREGHARVPTSHAENGIRLGGWVGKVRGDRNSGRLSPERAKELEALPGWTWDPMADYWETAIAALRAFVAREGHARVPATYLEGRFSLGTWVGNQRRGYHAGRLSSAQIAQLEGFPRWSWDPHADDWAAAMVLLRAYVAREGHARVPRDHAEGKFRLGIWVGKQRLDYNATRMRPERALQLEALPGWTWDPVGDDWAAAMTALRGYIAREGHARVPHGHVEGPIKLGVWVGDRRRERHAGELSPERIAEFEALTGWTW